MTLRTGKRNSGAAAFTLIEILLVAAVLAVLAAVSLPNFSRNFQRLRLKQAAHDLSYALRYAQSRAVTADCDVAVVFADGFHSYRLQESAPGGFRDLEGRWGGRFDIPAELSVAASRESVLFMPDGTMDKSRVEICREEECYLVSAGLLRGQVEVFSYRTDE